VKNLFVYKPKHSLITLKLFCDEIITENWLYFGILIIPEHIEKTFLKNLLNKRCGNEKEKKIWGTCIPSCRFHEKNDTEVHYSEIEKSKDKYFIAQRWLDFLLSDRDYIYFKILGIDLNKLEKSFFGDRKQQNNIYNRFFRTAILKSVKYYFYSFENIIIDTIYHDKSSALSNHDYFPWHSIFNIGSKDKKVSFKNDAIDFIDSDHRISNNQYSHFIQFIDLLLGCTHNCIEHTSTNEDKEDLAFKSLPLIERLIEKPYNRHSKFKYAGRQSIEFFPKHSLLGLDDNSLEYRCKRRDLFYTKRTIKLKSKGQKYCHIRPFKILDYEL
jgi:hypothetical protein